MKARKLPWILAAVFLSVIAGAAQEGRLVVDGGDSKDLKRTARRLHISVERLKNARQVLREATECALRHDVSHELELNMLGQWWISYHRAGAKSAIESLVAGLRLEALEAPDAAAYQQASSAMLSLVPALAQLDPNAAVSVSRTWPEAPSSPPDLNTGRVTDIKTEALRRLMYSLPASNPEQAMSMLDTIGISTADYSMRAQVAMQLASRGSRDAAEKLLDGVMQDYLQRPKNERSATEYLNFLQHLPHVDIDRYLAGVKILADSFTGEGQPALTMQIGDRSLQLTQLETSLLNSLRNAAMRPQAALSALDYFPALKQKLDAVGGIDAYLNPTPVQSAYRRASPAGSPYVRTSSGPPDSSNSLYEELRGKASSDPGLVRNTLRETLSQPEALDALISLARRASWEDPELGSLALEIAQPLLGGIEDLERRSHVLQNMVRAYRECDGEVDPSLLREGFLLADSLREESERRPPPTLTPPPRRMRTPADRLEAFLVSELSRDDFAGAMRYVRSLSDEHLRLACLVQTLQALREPPF